MSEQDELGTEEVPCGRDREREGKGITLRRN